MLREQIPAREDELGQPVRRPSGQRGLGAFSPRQPSRAADNVTGLDRDIQAAKREALRDLEDDPKFRALSEKEQRAARTRITSAVSRRYTDRRKAAVVATLSETSSPPREEARPTAPPASTPRPTATVTSQQIIAAIKATQAYRAGASKTRPTAAQQALYDRYVTGP